MTVTDFRSAKWLRTTLLMGAAAGVLAACAPSGPGPGPGPDPDPEPLPSWITESVADRFDYAEAALIRQRAAYLNVDANFTSGPFASLDAHPYDVIRLHVALSAGLTGAGQLVHVVDSGFLLNHEAFAGTQITTFGPNTPDDHGTHVASLITGDSTTMHGVAPNADLFLSSFLLSLDNRTAANLAAAQAGAVAQNNSWGNLAPGNVEVTVDQVANYMQANNATLAQALAATFGLGSAAQWQANLDSLDTFQENGVIVWALSNDPNLPNADIDAALPLLDPSLADAWISVANGAFALDANLNITDAALVSAACGSTAEFCLTADGTTFAAEAGNTQNYGAGTGTSYAAPQVAGGVALMAEAFPNLTPEEWADRLLASATDDFDDFNAIGQTDFGNGVVSDYSWEYGQGVMNLEAALSPIGTLAIVNGANVHTSDRFDLSRSHFSSGGAFGDAVPNALGDTEIAVFDGLNGDFYISAASLAAQSTNSALLDSPAIPRLASDGSLDMALDHGSWGLVADGAPVESTVGSYTVGMSAIDGHTYLQDTLGLTSENVAGTSVLSLSQDTTAVVGSYDMGFAQFQQFGFIGTHSENVDGMMAGVGGALAFDMGNFGLTIGASQISEQGGFLGMTATEAFAMPGQTAITTASLAATADITSNLTVFGGAEYGVAFGGTGTGLIAELDQATFSGFQMGVRATGLLAGNDQLTFTASQPMRVESGSIAMRVPTGRTQNGDVVYGLVEGPLEASGRQLDLGLSYAFEPVENGLLRFGFVYSLDAGHVAGREAGAVAASFAQSF